MDQALSLGIPELEDLLKKLDEKAALTEDNHFLLNEVRFSNLRKMNDANLVGRLAYYERDYARELHKRTRAEFYREIVRTKIEIRRREREQSSVGTASASQLGHASASQATDAPLRDAA